MANYVSESTKPQTDEGKKKLNPQVIYNDIKASAKGALIKAFIAAPILLIVLGMIAFAFYMVKDAKNEEWINIVTPIMLSIPFLALLCSVCSYYSSIRKLQNGRYTLITDTVSRVVKDDKKRFSHRVKRYTITMEHAMYLHHCGRVVITEGETDTVWEGDIFYIVVDKKRPKKPIITYNSKFYDLEDIEPE